MSSHWPFHEVIVVLLVSLSFLTYSGEAFARHNHSHGWGHVSAGRGYAGLVDISLKYIQ
jgi:hypothetical protein